MDKNVFVYTYRYMWQVKGNKSVNFKIVTDTEEGLTLFEKNLLSLPDIDRASKEYLSQIDISKMGLFESLKNYEKEIKLDEKV